MKKSLLMIVAVLGAAGPAGADDAKHIDTMVNQALVSLYQSTPVAITVGKKARAILVLPQIGDAGYYPSIDDERAVVRKDLVTTGYYRIDDPSFAIESGLRRSSYALYFMTDDAVAHLEASGGFEIGKGPTLTVVDEELAESIMPTTLDAEVYVFVFDRDGIVKGAGVEPAKLTPVEAR